MDDILSMSWLHLNLLHQHLSSMKRSKRWHLRHGRRGKWPVIWCDECVIFGVSHSFRPREYASLAFACRCESEHVRSWLLKKKINERQTWKMGGGWKMKRKSRERKDKGEKAFHMTDVMIFCLYSECRCCSKSYLPPLCRNIINCDFPHWILASCRSALAVSFGLVCCFSGTGRLLLHSSVRMGRVPPDCVLAFGLHKPQLPNKHYRHGDGGRGVEQSCMLAVEKMFSMFLLMIMNIHHWNWRFTAGTVRSWHFNHLKVLWGVCPCPVLSAWMSLISQRMAGFVCRLQVVSCPGDSR